MYPPRAKRNAKIEREVFVPPVGERSEGAPERKTKVKTFEWNHEVILSIFSYRLICIKILIGNSRSINFFKYLSSRGRKFSTPKSWRRVKVSNKKEPISNFNLILNTLSL